MIQTAYRVSILTFISFTKKEKGLGPIPYSRATTELFSIFAVPRRDTPDFKPQEWSNGGKNQTPQKSLDQNLTPK